jgi:4-hydroxy-2-oxoheptanedioate aldolase
MVATRVNRAIELLEQDQAIYYVGQHTGHVLSYAQGREDARTWADYINVGMEHGAFDMPGLAEYMRGLVDGGPTSSGHRTPAVIVEPPVRGIDEASVRNNTWQLRQILARGVHGMILCQAESPDAVRAFVEATRYPHHAQGVDPALPSPLERMRRSSEAVPRQVEVMDRPLLGVGTRGRGSEATAAAAWGVSHQEYMERATLGRSIRRGELLLGVKLESPEGVANCEAILAVPGLAFAEMGPGDLGLAFGYTTLQLDPYPPELQEARARVFRRLQRRTASRIWKAARRQTSSRGWTRACA